MNLANTHGENIRIRLKSSDGALIATGFEALAGHMQRGAGPPGADQVAPSLAAHCHNSASRTCHSGDRRETVPSSFIGLPPLSDFGRHSESRRLKGLYMRLGQVATVSRSSEISLPGVDVAMSR